VTGTLRITLDSCGDVKIRNKNAFRCNAAITVLPPVAKNLSAMSFESGSHDNENEKALRERQTLRAGCSVRRRQKFSPRRRPPSMGRRTAKI